MTITVDTHHHTIPDFYWQATNDPAHPVGGLSPAQWSVPGALAFLDEARTDVAVVSISTPGVHVLEGTGPLDMARRCNELIAGMVRDHPRRFGGFACLPLPDIDAALVELEYALDTLALDGILLFTNARGIYLGDDFYLPVFEELQRRKAVVFVHPTVSPDPTAHQLGLPDNLLDFVVDTSRAIAQLHYRNVFARTPDVRFIFSHAGGTIPYLAGRLAILDEMGFIPGSEARSSAAETFRNLYWDTAASWQDPVLHTLKCVVGVDKVVFGTDYPYIRRDLAVAGRHDLDTTAELTDSEREQILGGTALTLFPRLAAAYLPAR